MKQPLKFKLLKKIGVLVNKETQNKLLNCSTNELKKLLKIWQNLKH